ncbi:VWA domain-containing protein, partial [Jejuia pallidilutea]|uniref:VWA domain-containing protein n=1 Tax=Jejuia pallidilutea TaxID=504487 RepID=UPI0005EE01E0
MKNPLLFHRINKKRPLQFVLVLCFILSVNTLFSQEVKVNKYAVDNPTNCNQFDITLEVIGDPPTQPQEVILVIDRSGSMGFDDGNPTTPLPIDAAIDAAIDFVNQLFLPVNNPTGLNKIALVTYASSASLNVGLVDSSGQTTLINAISSIVANGATNTEQAIQFADNELINNGTFDCKTSRSIILLSDGAPTRRANGILCPTTTSITSCQTAAIQAAQNSWTTTVAGETYNQNLFTIGLLGGISGTEQTIAINTLNQMQNSGAFMTENNADLTTIYNNVLGQLVAAATQLPSQALVTDNIEPGYVVIPGSIVASKGTGSVSGQTLSWNVNSVSNETITLNYTIEGTPTVCGVNPSGASTINYQDSSCNTASITFNNPTVCLPCPEINPTITQNGCASIDYSSTVNQGGCSSMADSYAWEFFLDGNSIGTSNTLNGTFNYTGTPPFQGDFTATLTYTGTYGTGCILPNVTENSNTITLSSVLDGNIISQTNADCVGGNNGEIVVEGINGTPPYSYSIDGGSNYQPSGTFPNLTVGSYTINILDSLGCSTTVNTTLTDGADAIPPTAICQNITVQLDAAGNASITAAQVDNGSNDNCGIASLALDVTDFTCANIGDNTVELTVTDNNGNTDSCNATVTVEDNVSPNAICQNITVQLDAAGNASITA